MTISRLAIFSLLVLIGGSAAMAAASDSVPRLDPSASCRGASRGGDPQADLKNCLQEEQGAHDQLVKEWSTFASSDRASCVDLSTMGGESSYVELLTCLEMAKAAREAPPDELAPSASAQPAASSRRRP